jgi:hypothetical protein
MRMRVPQATEMKGREGRTQPGFNICRSKLITDKKPITEANDDGRMEDAPFPAVMNCCPMMKRLTNVDKVREDKKVTATAMIRKIKHAATMMAFA